ncbi:MAG: hypothetical protein A2840_02425 [Candidatus Buchananbacteria bacterium RIFCSPHIGHO2_01_FULL_47_11b]|uniref:Uncharacterized protein n=1 Tax=Candidatus Buchananbacteria bacterium RIFCSPHIGHO2_01_FULL_47_11b TaxID=1797537 RepID=A0A1G1Y884_9BACT|nr:MAG: hypothetical protein A2840_02425 [Candidatus Buchananbacteria bacterium RIFCSPHIGHO2_01_FULL_47_11b]
MNDQKISDKVIAAIQTKRITPKPRWEFLLKDVVVWALAVLGLAVGSIATAVVIFITVNDDFRYVAGSVSITKQVLLNIPYFWLALIIIFGAVAVYNLRHTRHGYRYGVLLILGGSIIASVVLGSIVYATGGAESLEEIFYQRLPFYHRMFIIQGQLWNAPEQGRIAGEIIQIGPEYITVQDAHGTVWQVPTTTYFFKPGQRIRLFGSPINHTQFQPRALKQWYGEPGVRINFPPQSIWFEMKQKGFNQRTSE